MKLRQLIMVVGLLIATAGAVVGFIDREVHSDARLSTATCGSPFVPANPPVITNGGFFDRPTATFPEAQSACNGTIIAGRIWSIVIITTGGLQFVGALIVRPKRQHPDQ